MLPSSDHPQPPVRPRAPMTGAPDCPEVDGARWLEVLFHRSPLGIALAVGDMFREVNARLCEITGYRRDELIGQPVRLLHVSDQGLKTEREVGDGTWAGERAAFVETRLRRRSGEVIDVAVHSAPLDPADPERGLVVWMLANTVDRRTRTELTAALDRLQLALAGGELGIYETDLVTGEAWADDTYLSHIGLSRDDGEFQLADWRARVHPDDVEPLQRTIADLRAGRVDRADVEYRLRHRDGGWRWILDRSRVHARDDAGNTLRVAGVHLDITERKATEQALAELTRVLEQRVAERTTEVRGQATQLRALASQLTRAEQRERRRLAAILHDHIQPLMLAARMQVSRLPGAAHAAALEAAAQGIGEVLREALEAARSLAVELSPPVLHENGLVGGLSWLGSRMAERHGLDVRLRADVDAEPADDDARFLLFACARELLLNVAKHAGVGAAELCLTRPAAREIRLVVSDAGNGFDPEALQRLRPDEMSFGLFSIRERLAHINGRMELQSAPSRGTRVTLVAPVTAAPEPPDTAAAVTTARGAAGVTARDRPPQRCRVLLVDDHRIVRDGLAGLLQMEPDIEVIGAAADGEQAVARAVALRPDVIVMDIDLGAGINGIVATRRVLAADPSIRVIGLSMHVDRAVVEAMRDAGAVAFMTKGARSDDLIEAIRSQPRRPRVSTGQAG